MQYRFLAAVFLCAPLTAWAGAVVSDGSLGAFNPTGNQTINLQSVAPDGVLNYTTINIPVGVTIQFSANSANTPVFVAATGDVVIDGTIDVTAGHFSGVPGPGGSAGGAPGSGTGNGMTGSGLSPGEGGVGTTGQGNAGGGGGMATPGLVATSRTGVDPAAGGAAVGAPDLLPAETGGGGSGGGGGGGRNQCIGGCVPLSGGVGGGGGGAVQVATPGQLVINGTVRANGGHGSWGFANIFGHGGPGGGGSGGFVELYGATIAVGPTAELQAIGGAGGGLSTEPVPNDPYGYSSGANGGQGYVRFGTTHLVLDPAATIDAVIAADGDADSDGVLDSIDNCPLVSNGPTIPDAGGHVQRDTDGDGIGNVCDADITGDCTVNFGDLTALKSAFTPRPYDPDADFDGDGGVNFGDLAFMKSTFFNGENPGPGPGAPGNACD